MESIGTWYWYTGFAAFVIVAIIVDLLVLESKGAMSTAAMTAVDASKRRLE